MKLKQISALLIASVILLSGCSSGNSSDIPSITQSENSAGGISDPMKTPDTSQQASPSSSYGLSFGADDIDLSGNSLKIAPTLKGGENPTNAGFAVFIDGIPQKYRSENSSEYSYISGFDVEENSEKTHELTVRARADKALDEHFITIGSMLAPSFVPEPDAPYFGNYHRMLRNFSKTLPSEISSVSESVSINSLSAENSVLSKEDREKFSLGGGDESGYSTGVELLQSGDRLERNYSVKSGETSVSLKLFTYSTMPDVCKYRVSVFVNHNPVRINGDFDCVDVIMEGGKISKTDIILDNIKQGDFIYCIAAPLSEGNLLYKSDSKMVIGDKSGGSDSTAAPPAESAENIADKGAVVCGAGLNPMFATGDYLYAETKRGSAVFPALCKVNSNGDIVKTLADVSGARAHGDKISVVKYGGDTFYIGANAMEIMLLDKDLNVVKSLDINDSYGKIDFNENIIVYVGDDNKLCSCDWNWENHKTLFSLSTGYFVDIKLGEGFIAFNAQAEINDKDADFYGVCDFSGNYGIYRKDGINYSQVCGKTALWGDRHVDVINGQTPSGEIVLYSNGKFTKIAPENSLESQDVFLTGENEFFTSGDVLKQYKNGAKIREISVGKGNSAESIVHADSMLYAVVIEIGGRTMKCWELD